MTKIELAEQIATKAHEGQTRWDGSPYITHPRSVVARLKETTWGEDILICGWLHDVVEDTSVTLKDISDNFGKYNAEIVELLTHQKTDSYADYISKIGSCSGASLVKIADLEDNLSSLNPKKDRQRIDKYELARMYLKFRIKCS